jgi:hypothetical protein
MTEITFELVREALDQTMKGYIKDKEYEVVKQTDGVLASGGKVHVITLVDVNTGNHYWIQVSERQAKSCQDMDAVNELIKRKIECCEAIPKKEKNQE